MKPDAREDAISGLMGVLSVYDGGELSCVPERGGLVTFEEHPACAAGHRRVEKIR